MALSASQRKLLPLYLRANPSREILSQKKELVRIASEVALNLINHFGPSYDGGYAGVANSPLLPRSIRAVIDTMSQPFDAPNAKNKIMYYPKSYDVQEWQKRGNMANHIWFGQTDKGHDEVIRKGIAIAKAGNVFKNRRRGLRRNESTNKYEMRFTPRSTGIFVWMTDKFMSGWGQARGKINKLIIRCDTLEQAECIFKNAQMREEMKNINYGRKLPYFSESKYKLSFKTWDQLGYVWKTGCKWQNEDDYYSDPGRMRY